MRENYNFEKMKVYHKLPKRKKRYREWARLTIKAIKHTQRNKIRFLLRKYGE